jgi:hypothetical protein
LVELNRRADDEHPGERGDQIAVVTGSVITLASHFDTRGCGF